MSHPELRTISVAGHSLSFDLSLGARITQWNYQGLDLIGVRGSDPVENGCYPMAPGAGRIAGNSLDWQGEAISLPVNYQGFALHGYVLDRPIDSFQENEFDDSVEIQFTTMINDWIAPLRIDMKWQLMQHEIHSTIAASTPSLDPIPVVLGWHPWFNNVIDGDQVISLDYQGLELAVKAGDFPSGDFIEATKAQGPYDDAFRSKDKLVNLRWGNRLNISICNSHEWFVIYNGAEGFTCVEPQTGPPNAFHNPLDCSTITTVANNPLIMSTTWKLTAH